MQKEIGSNFWLSPEEASISDENSEVLSPVVMGFDGNDYVWTSTGRSSLSLVIKTIEERNPHIKKVACVPPFTCHTVYEPFMEAGYKVIMYPVEKDLMSDGKLITKCALENGAAIVLFHRYFGFDTLSAIDASCTALRSHGIVTIEDVTQSLYSGFSPAPVDYYVASIRKWCGVPDGGFAVCRRGFFNIRPSVADQKLGGSKLDASLSKYDWIFNGTGDKETFLNKYREAESILASQDRIYSIYPLSLAIQANLNSDYLKERRQKNYMTLLNGIKGIESVKPIFEHLTPNVVPLYFPIYCEDRRKIQSLLAQNNIYAPIVWPKDSKCPDIDSNVQFIYEHILCIPIDQRYGADDMGRIVSVLKRDLLWTGWMTWKQIEPYKEQLIDWELEVMVKHHCSDKIISRDYLASLMENLKNDLESGNTFFWGATENGRLIGYYWAYTADFLGYKRWYSRSCYICETARGKGLGKRAHIVALGKAIELECDEAVSSYAHFNHPMAHICQNLGYTPSRIEIVKELNKELPSLHNNAPICNGVNFNWMTWKQIEPYKEQLIDWELEVMVKHHYPDKIISRDYPASRVENLKNHLESGNTFFWGATENGRLIGYYWAYVTICGADKIWVIRSNFISKHARGRGLGMLSYISGLKRAFAEGCTKSVSMYASFNNEAARIYDLLEYEITNIEVVKQL